MGQTQVGFDMRQVKPRSGFDPSGSDPDHKKEVLEIRLSQGLLQAGCVEEKIS
ncbi:45715_t:CDS:2, partial [Gigaspora margarita]